MEIIIGISVLLGFALAVFTVGVINKRRDLRARARKSWQNQAPLLGVVPPKKEDPHV